MTAIPFWREGFTQMPILLRCVRTWDIEGGLLDAPMVRPGPLESRRRSGF